MPVNNKKSNLYLDPDNNQLTPADPHMISGKLVLMTGTVTNGASDSTASTYLLASVPSHALMHEMTFFDVENWGFAQVVIGTETDTDALLDVARSAATEQTPFAIGDANHGKQLWEILGMGSDPGGDIDLYAHAEAAATALGDMPFRVAYIA